MTEATAAMASGAESNSARVTQLSLLVPRLAERLKVYFTSSPNAHPSRDAFLLQLPMSASVSSLVELAYIPIRSSTGLGRSTAMQRSC